MRQKVSFLFALLLLALPTQAQERRTLHQRAEQLQDRIDSLRHIVRSRADSVRAIHLMDSLLDVRDKRARSHYDTTYIAKPAERWTLKVRGNVTGNHILLRGETDGDNMRADLNASHKATMSFAVGYRGLTLSFAVNPLKWAGKYKDLEYNVISYGRRFGFDASYVTANTFGGYLHHGNVETDVERGYIGQRLLCLNGYYVFNHRRFSYPAAFSQSQIQLRSAGSWLLGASINGGKLKMLEAAQDMLPYSKIKYVNIGLGGGYGYNLVLGRVMLHASVISELVVANFSRASLENEEAKMPWRFPNFIVQARVGALYNWRKSFIGLTATSNFTSMGDKDQLDILNVRYLARAFYGFRF